MFTSKPSRIAAAVALAIGISASAYAQDTASSLRGVITTEAGTTVANANVVVTDQRTGTTRTLTTNESGTFSARGLQVGGPYRIEATDPTTGVTTVEEVFLTLGDTSNVNLMFESQNVERITVTGGALMNSNYGGTGPASTFGLQTLETAPAINRDIKDVVRIDPRVYVDESFGDGIQCAGANPRFNSLTVDGVRLNDNFGLNSNGYPTERMPFSYDAIEQVAVELAPFDVKYGGFTACNINAVTKSGQNEMFGGVFYDYTNDSLRGDELEGTPIDNGDYSEKRYGINLGGAIIEDTLFFFAAYEKFEGVSNFTRGPGGSNAGTPVFGVSQAQLDRIATIARDQYGYEPGSPIASSPVEDEKLLVKLDWQINNLHRAAFTYNYNDGASISQSDGDNDEYEFSNHYYTRGAELTSYVGELYSDWTDSFSTEMRAGYTELDNTQQSLSPTPFGEVQITTLNDHDGDGEDSRATVYMGVDDSRQANDLYYDTSFFKLAGTYFVGDHVIYGGYEYESYDVFNKFVQHAIGEYRFDSIDDFEAGTPARIYYGSGAGTNNPDDAAGAFGYAIHTAYLQDEYYMYEHDLTLTFGLRYDWYTSSDLPQENENFVDRYGFTNAQNLDGKGLLQPRFGFNWMPLPQLEVRGGVGLYSGGNPNVWLANNYQQNGISQIQLQDRSGRNLFETELSGDGQPIYNVPQDMYDAVANASGDSAVNVLDPNFDIPSEWKYALGATYTFDSGYVVMTDLLYTDRQESATIVDLALEQVGTAPDGRPIYDSAFDDGRNTDFMLTNTDNAGSQFSFSTSVSKQFDFGLDMTLAYAYTEAEDAYLMGSSVAYSNYTQTATADIQNAPIATSNYEIPHRFTLRALYQKDFVDGYTTTFSLFGSRNKGRPFSYAFVGSPFGDYARGRQLLYVPTGADDSNVVFGPDFNTDAFFDFIEESGLDKFAGGIAPRNEFEGKWWTKVDFKISQEIPGFTDGHKAKAFFVIENLGNMLNDDWGVFYQPGFPQISDIVDAELTADGSQFQFNEFFQPGGQSRVTSASLWEVRLGVEYKF